MLCTEYMNNKEAFLKWELKGKLYLKLETRNWNLLNNNEERGIREFMTHRIIDGFYFYDSYCKNNSWLLY